MHGGVQVQIEVRRIIEDRVDLVTAGVHTVGNRPVVSVVVFVVEETNPNIAVVVTRRAVEMKGGHVAIEPVPVDVVAHSLVFCVKIEAGDTPPIVVSAIFKLVTIELYQELVRPVVVVRGELLC